MLLTLSTTHRPASDLGYLLHKHPGKMQSFNLAFGQAHVFYPQATDETCSACLLVEIDTIGLVRGRGGKQAERTLDQYVNDRPYVASSMLAVAISQVFGTALAGNCKDRPELVTQAIPLMARLEAICSRGGEELLRKLFEPLGYQLSIVRHALDERFPSWGASTVYTVEISGTRVLSDFLSHLYVLIPVLDNEKHYWVGDGEVDKLIRHGEGWLSEHPERELIATRYLKYRRNLVDDALRQLREQDGDAATQIENETPEDPREEVGEKKLSLHQQRHGVVLSVLQAKHAKRVIDLGCGEGRLLRELLRHKTFDKIVGMDVAHRTIEIAADRLRYDELPPMQRERLALIHGSLMYRDRRLEKGGELVGDAGFDAGVLCEVIEHLDEPRLSAMERVVFGCIKPNIVIVTTPNSEYNVMWETLSAGAMRHRDHRFEWTREQFKGWAARMCDRFGYTCEFRAVGDIGQTPEGVDVGPPTQMGVFSRVS